MSEYSKLIEKYEEIQERHHAEMSKKLAECAARKGQVEILKQQRDDLRDACEEAFKESHNPKVEKILEAAIAKAKKVGG